MLDSEFLLGYHGTEVGLSRIESSKTRYRTATSNRDPERQLREVRIVPCAIRGDFILEGSSMFVDNLSDDKVRAILKKGAFVTTDLKSVGKQQPQDFALLMAYASGEVYSGRGGILLRKIEEQWKPVIVRVDTGSGFREYLVDIKGTGTPDGRLMIDKERGCIGGLINGAKQEFETLQVASQQHPLFKRGLVPIGLYYGKDSRGFGQVARAIPTTLRPSFRENDAFEKLRLLNPDQIAYGLGEELGRYLAFDPPYLASNLQTENAYLVNASSGQEVIATDFMEIIPLHQQIDPITGLEIALTIIRDSVYESPKALEHVARGLVRGLKEIKPDMDVEEEEAARLTSTDSLTEYLLSKHFAWSIINHRRLQGIAMDAQYLRSKFDKISANFYRQHPAHIMQRELINFLEQEERLFHHVNKSIRGSDIRVRTALDYVVDAKGRIQHAQDNYEITDKNIGQYEALLPIPYYRE